MSLFNNFVFNNNILICLTLLIVICMISSYIWYSNISYSNKRKFMFVHNLKDVKHNGLMRIHLINFFAGSFVVILLLLLIYVDSYTDAGFSGWISGIGSMSAAVVALYSIMRKKVPIIKLVHIFNPADQSLTIQVLNESNVPDFIKLDNISAHYGMFNDTFDKKLISKSKIDYNLYHKLPANGICTFRIFGNLQYSSRQTGINFTESSDMLEWLKQEYRTKKTHKINYKSQTKVTHGFTHVIFYFTDTYGTSGLCEDVNIDEFYKNYNTDDKNSPIIFND